MLGSLGQADERGLRLRPDPNYEHRLGALMVLPIACWRIRSIANSVEEPIDVVITCVLIVAGLWALKVLLWNVGGVEEISVTRDHLLLRRGIWNLTSAMQLPNRPDVCQRADGPLPWSHHLGLIDLVTLGETPRLQIDSGSSGGAVGLGYGIRRRDAKQVMSLLAGELQEPMDLARPSFIWPMLGYAVTLGVLSWGIACWTGIQLLYFFVAVLALLADRSKPRQIDDHAQIKFSLSTLVRWITFSCLYFAAWTWVQGDVSLLIMVLLTFGILGLIREGLETASRAFDRGNPPAAMQVLFSIARLCIAPLQLGVFLFLLMVLVSIAKNTLDWASSKPQRSDLVHVVAWVSLTAIGLILPLRYLLRRWRRRDES